MCQCKKNDNYKVCIGAVVPFVVPGVLLGIMVVSGRGGHRHSEKEGEEGTADASGAGSHKVTAGTFELLREQVVKDLESK